MNREISETPSPNGIMPNDTHYDTDDVYDDATEDDCSIRLDTYSVGDGDNLFLTRFYSPNERSEEMSDNNNSVSNHSNNKKGYGSCLSVAMKILIVSLSSVTIVISIYSIYSYGVPITQPVSLTRETMSVPCDDLQQFFPVSSLYHYTDVVTNQRFKDAGIHRDNVNGGTDCEVLVADVLGRMAKKDLNMVEAQLQLQVGDMGPALDYSNYNLTITHAEVQNLEINRTTITLTKEGFYFVFFGIQLSYGPEHDSPMCKDLQFKTSVTHLIRHRNHSDSQKYRALLRAEHTCCESCDTERSTEYTGGLFHLAKEDILFIQVSAPAVIGKGGDNFLGLFSVTVLE